MFIGRRAFIVMMTTFTILLVAGVIVGLVIGLSTSETSVRKFKVDHVRNRFLMDGEPFRYVSGSFHYFRAMPAVWRERLRTMRAAGLNAVDTYVEWSLHNPRDGVYKWDGAADLEAFLRLAQEENLYVILRPGPYICAERDNGGLPYWLFNKFPQIKPRTSDQNYINEVQHWYSVLMPRIVPFLYGNGGPIIMVQVENEYGHLKACDKHYLQWLRDETQLYVQNHAVLFTTDIPDERMKCGKIEGVLATTDFGIDRVHDIDNIWKRLRKIQLTGPLVNSEFYPGWLTHWQEANQRRDAKTVANALEKILSYDASVNIYMFFGGTNFGFTAGANDFGYGNYTPDITSYDYDAVMDEAGDVTMKYQLISEVVKRYIQTPTLEPINPPTIAKKMPYGRVEMRPICQLLSNRGRETLGVGSPVMSENAQTFESLKQNSGLLLYEANLPEFEIDPTLLSVEQLHDRAFVLVDDQFVGTLSRENRINALPLNKGIGNKLQILVENQGRINFNFKVDPDIKGILGAVKLQKLDGSSYELQNWTHTSFPLEEMQLKLLLEKHAKGKLANETIAPLAGNLLRQGPVVYYGELQITELGDTYLNTQGWGKGVAYINGFNLGRYWPLVGPQITLYVPKEVLRVDSVNTIVLVEYQRVGSDANATVVQLQATAQLDGK